MSSERPGAGLAILLAGLLSGCGGPAAEPTSANNCGPGTFALAGECVAMPSTPPPECGDGTHAVDGACVPEAAPTVCGEGTKEVGGACVPSSTRRPSDLVRDRGPVCGTGTGEVDNTCVRDAVEMVECGEGTEERDGECASLDVSCGEGTHVEAGECVADHVGASCGEGTEARGPVCVTLGSLDCGEGTVQNEDLCELEAPPVTCGADVHAEEGTCVADGLGLECDPAVEVSDGYCVGGDDNAPCGDDTHVRNLECRADGRALPDGSYSLATELTEAFADGYSLLKIAALGRNAGGLPAEERVIVRADRPGAGRFQVAEAQLTRLGRPFWFRPCSYAGDPDCAGPVSFELALADDPETILARTRQVELIVPENIPWFHRCDRPGNTLWMHGARDHGIMDGERLVTEPEARFFGYASREIRYRDRVGVFVDSGDWSWTIWFDTSQLQGGPEAQVYPRVEGPDPSTNTPGLMLDSPLDHCQVTDAEVQIRELRQVVDGANNRTERMAMSFVADCVYPAYGRVVGCVNFDVDGGQR